MSKNTGSERHNDIRQLRDTLMLVERQLSLSQLVALLTIALEPGLSVNELAEKLEIPQQSASRYVAVLTGRYQSELVTIPIDTLIVQQINEGDPRRRALFLSDAGEKFIAGILSKLSVANQG